MERRLRALELVYQGGDSDEVTRCADYLYWAMRCTPYRVSEVEKRWRAFRGYIDRSGMDERHLPRALALALSRLSDAPIHDAVRLVDDVGAELLLVAMAMPTQHRADFIEQAPDQRVPFLHGLLAYG